MRGANTSVLVLSGLAALTKAREVNVDDVPVECATICGPIVELTYKCDVDNSFDELKRLKRWKVDDVPANPPPESIQEMRHHIGDAHGVMRRHHHRRPAQDDAQASTPAQEEQRVVPTNAAEAQPAADPSPVFIATLPFAAPAPDPALSTPDAQNTPTPNDAVVIFVVIREHVNERTDNEHPPASPTSVDHLDRLPDGAGTGGTPTDPGSASRASPASRASSSSHPGPSSCTGTAAGTASSSDLPSAATTTAASATATAIINITTAATTSRAAAPAATTPWAPFSPPQVSSSSSFPPSPSAFPEQTTTPQPTPPQQIPPQASSSNPAAQPVVGGGPEKQPDQQQQENRENAERQCICANKSFNVQLLAGLCQSCIRKSGNRANNLDIIMGECNFTEANYTPDKDRLVDTIRVVAQRPFLSSSGNVMGDAGRVKAGSAAAAAVIISLVAGLVLFL
ncbi:hypothetical protein ColLi_01532 [Colletotrichum liriopes]|uniref:Uncharacterized protein n=1 Tax=Colletotrichum liriopes TaxID=708192 RepID=A0AA37GDI2_9PEZI|nr:hypothetical protein ColLi_01532 [Colletotrichum liriopes]